MKTDMKKDRAKTVCICNGCKELLEYVQVWVLIQILK